VPLSRHSSTAGTGLRSHRSHLEILAQGLFGATRRQRSTIRDHRRVPTLPSSSRIRARRRCGRWAAILEIPETLETLETPGIQGQTLCYSGHYDRMIPTTNVRRLGLTGDELRNSGGAQPDLSMILFMLYRSLTAFFFVLPVVLLAGGESAKRYEKGSSG
jgi:hypothetical protein